MKKEYSIWISIVSLLLSVIAVCVAVWRSPELDFDYQGVLVGVLSLLVTILIGWNIYTLVDLRNLQNKMEGLAKGTSMQINANMAGTADILFNPKRRILIAALRIKREFPCL